MTYQDLDSPMRMDEGRVPGLYFSLAKLVVQTLIPKRCKCNECPIGMNTTRIPKRYFCKEGKAKISKKL